MEGLLQNEAFSAGLFSLIAILVPAGVSLYAERRERPKILNDIAIYTKWMEYGDPAGLEFCRQRINQEVKKLYAKRGITWKMVCWLIIYIVGLLYSVYVIVCWWDATITVVIFTACALIYGISLVMQINKMRLAAKLAKDKNELASDIMRQYSTCVTAKKQLLELQKHIDDNSDETVLTVFNACKELNKELIENIIDMAANVDGVDTDYLEASYRGILADELKSQRM